MEILLFLCLVTILAVLNNQMSKKIWRPFHDILQTIRDYKVDRAESLHFETVPISEFNELARAIEVMSAKINQEFNNQKEFSENASHEIQTPLAVIMAKLEVLMQSPDLNENQMMLIGAASAAAVRLSKLNEALIILSRIENRQFHMVENICLNEVVDRHLNNLDEVIQMKQISIRRHYKETAYCRMNPFLADILFENLIVNAIKHNQSPGFVSITIENSRIVLSNTGEEPQDDPQNFFQRFKKGSHHSSSLGLGLPIVKAVCETYSLPLHYRFESRIHEVKIDFKINVEN